MDNAFLCRPLPMTLTASGATAAGPATNAGNDRLGRAWQTPGGGAYQLIADLGKLTTIDTAALLATDFLAADSVQITAFNSTSLIAGNVVSDVTISALASADGARRVHRQCLAKFAPVSARVVRFIVTAAAQRNVGRAVVGAAYQPGDNIDFGWEFAVTDAGSVDRSAMGVETAMLGAKTMQYKFGWGWETEAEARGAALDLAAYAGTTRKVLLCVDSDATDRHNLIGFGRLGEGARFTQIALDGYVSGHTLNSDLVLSL